MPVIADELKPLALALITECGCFLDKTRSPGGLGFRLKAHAENPHLPLSPVYIDLRKLMSFPRWLRLAAEAYVECAEGNADLFFDLVAAIPLAAVPVGTMVSQIAETPLIIPRMEAKGHGSGAVIEGDFRSEQTALLVDDLISTSKSKREAAEALRAAGIIVTDVVVLIDREQGGREELATAGMNLHAVFQLSDLLELYRDEGLITPEVYDEIIAYLRPQA